MIRKDMVIILGRKIKPPNLYLYREKGKEEKKRK